MSHARTAEQHALPATLVVGDLMPLDPDEVRFVDSRRATALAVLSTWDTDADERLRAAAATMRRTIERHPKPFAQRCRWCDHVYPCPDLADVLDTLAPRP